MIICSNNQWKCDNNNETWAKMGMDCSAEHRVPLLAKAYNEIRPDVLALQEVSVRMARILMEHLGEEYEYISGGDTPVVYRCDKLKLLESAFFRYTEEIEGLEGSFNNSETKSYTLCVFERRDTKSRFVLVSTHLWWKSSHPEDAWYQPHSAEARAYQIGLCMDAAEKMCEKYGCTGLIMGDLNAGMDSRCLKACYARNWIDVHDLATGERAETKGHHHCAGDGFVKDAPGRFEEALDHILLKGGSPVRFFKRYMPEWLESVTDHSPLYAEIEL